MKQLIFLTLVTLLLSCKKEAAPNVSYVSPSLKIYVQEHTDEASFSAVQWKDARSLTVNGKGIGYIVPCMGPGNGQMRQLIALPQANGWLCNWQIISNHLPATGSFSGSVTMTSLDGRQGFVTMVEHNRIVAGTLNNNDPSGSSQANPLQDITGLGIAIVSAPTAICYNGVPYFMLIGNGATGSPGAPVYYITTDDAGAGGAGGGPDVITVNFEYLAETLVLDQAEYLWLFDHAMEASQTYLYLQSSALPEKTAIAKEHLNELIYNTRYRNFAERHTQTGNPQLVWWMDDQWLDDPVNFTLDADKDSLREVSKLNAEERVLVSLYPVQAGIISFNVDEAYEMSTSRMGTGTNNGVNDKKDAFRHAFFQAINVRDAPSRLIPYISADNIVKAFAIAHESEVPTQLALEKVMDLFNNNIGIEYGKTIGYFTTNETVANTIQQKLISGLLRYLDPLDIVHHPYFTSLDPGNLRNTNGIIPGVTIMIPTNR